MAKAVLIVIPARLTSSRLPRKMLLSETGKPLVRHAYENAQSSCADYVVVATDSEEISRVVEAFGGRAVLTSPDHQSGTQRVAEALERLCSAGDVPIADDSIVINLQGDEPSLGPREIDYLVSLHRACAPFMGTLASKFPTHAHSGSGSPLDPSAVKVVLGHPIQTSPPARKAIYFSRSLVPYTPLGREYVAHPEDYYLHVGIYSFSCSSLREFANLPHGKLEKREGLEQLRALENGRDILVGEISPAGFGVDTPQDYAAFLARERRVW